MAEELLDDTLKAAPVDAEAGDGAAAVPTEPDGTGVPDDSTSRGDDDPLDRLLAQYDEEQAANGAAASGDDDIVRLLEEANQNAAREQEFAAAQQRYANESAQAAVDLSQREYENNQLRQTVGQLQNVIAQEQWRQHQERSKADLDALIAPIQKELEAEGLDIPPDFVETQLIAAGVRNPALVEAWESRYFTGHDPLRAAQLEAAIRQQADAWAKAALAIANPAQRQAAQRHIEDWIRRAWQSAFVDPQEHRAKGDAVVRRAIDQIVKQARRPRIDHSVTGDVLAVAQAVRGASTSKPPPEVPVNLGRLSEGEFRRHTMERYGF